MILGGILIKVKLLKAEDSKVLSKIILYIVMPCTIINAFQIQYTEIIRNGLILAFFTAILIHIILLILAKIIGDIFKLDAIEKASIIYSNAGNLIIPIIISILGKDWVIYTSAFISVQLILLWTHGRVTLCGKKGIEIKDIILNINIISILLGCILFFSRVQIPNILIETIDSVSLMIGPLSMLVMGMLFSNMRLKQILSFKRIYLVTFFKMILFPIIMLVILKYSGLSGLVSNGNKILLISLLATISPSASSITQMAQVYDENAEYASTINIVTTIICIITMPILVLLYQM